jgi:hypothetical protein
MRRWRDRASDPLYLQGLRRFRRQWRLSPDVARNTEYSHAWPADGPILAQTLDRLSVSRRPGYMGVGFALSVPTPRVGFGVEKPTRKTVARSHPYTRQEPRQTMIPLDPILTSLRAHGLSPIS